MEVGIRELKAKLSEYVARAAGGEEVIVTDRGVPAARLVGLDEGSAVRRGIADGWISAPSRVGLAEVVPRRGISTVHAVLEADRG